MEVVKLETLGMRDNDIPKISNAINIFLVIINTIFFLSIKYL